MHFRSKNRHGGTDDEQQRRLTQPLLLEEGRAPHIFASLLSLACVFILALVVWGSVTTIRELAIAPGEIIPAGSVQFVQHLEGGIVLELLVKEGQVVEKDTPLARLQPNAAGSDLEQLRVRRANFRLQIERLEAAIHNRVPDFSKYREEFPDLTREQLAVFAQVREQHSKEREKLLAQIEQKDAEIDSNSDQVGSLGRQVKIQSEQLSMRRGLLKQGLVSRVAFLETRRIYEKTYGEMLAARGRLKTGLEALNESRIALLEFEAATKRKLVDERAKVAGELAELDQSLEKHEDRVSRLVVRAPMRGVVQELVPKATGQVLKPGDLVAKLVPLGQELVAEVQVAPNDIGHIKVGHDAEIKITTFDAARFGGVTGVVRNLSATTFHTEKGEPYYKAVIALHKDYVEGPKKRHLILPGMVVNAEIITGAKSLARYLLKPVYRSLSVAFSER